MNWQKLKEVDATYTSGMTPEVAANYINTHTETTYKAISGNDLRIWCAVYEPDYLNLKAAAATSVKAEMAVELVTDPNSELDLNNATVRSLIDALLASNIISLGGHTALYAAGSENRTIAQINGFGKVKTGYIEEARRI